jgi:hypothetical protein
MSSVVPEAATLAGTTDETPSLDWLKADLLSYANVRGLAVSSSMTKAEILAVIEAAQEA